MRGIAALLLSGALLGLASPAFANGYDVYAAPLAWSPDGALLAAVVADRWPQDAVLVPGQLLLCDRYGRPLRVLAEGAVGSPGFSDDSEVLAAVVDGDLWLFRATDDWAGAPVTDRGDVLDCAVGAAGPAGEGPKVYFSAGERFYGAEVYEYDVAEDASRRTTWRRMRRGCLSRQVRTALPSLRGACRRAQSRSAFFSSRVSMATGRTSA
jgi:hypothetical protein